MPRLASGHDGVDGDFFHGCHSVHGRKDSHGYVSGFVKTFQHGFHAFGSGGNERQAVAPAPLQKEIIEGLEAVVPQDFTLFPRISGSGFSHLCGQDNINILSVFHLT